MVIFSEYQKIPLTETKCLRIVYADLEHQTIYSEPFTPCRLRRIWGIMDSIRIGYNLEVSNDRMSILQTTE